VVAAVLGNPELRALWEKELGEMRVRIKAMRQKLVDGLKAAGVQQDMSFITTQIGMFSYSGLSKTRWCACAASSACTAPTPAACAPR
jgi:aromatic-amino-acid transaminase